MANRLATESSPYLNQHAQNPVDWYPWASEALDRARTENLPILLSIGYSACHWCHVMERESFEDPSVAAVMNERFVCIKVDREERPDIDQIYMKAVQAMTGSGGWPMTVFLTPDRIPYYGGTYFPPTPRHGMPSFPQILRAASDAYRSRTDAVRAGGDQLLAALRKTTLATWGGSVGTEALDGAYRALAGQYDATYGGFGRAPKFPQPVTLEFLMRYSSRERDTNALEMVVHTLRRMAGGGLRDHLAGGFHRYSVDAKWLVPHFEKMLYDNALLACAYVDAYRLTDSDDLGAVAVETLDYMASDMHSPEGGFYSARDADSEGEEGTFYVWTHAEIEDELGVEDAALFSRVYDVSAGGNFEGRNILHLPHELSAVAGAVGMPLSELERRMASCRATLLEARSSREPPFRDEKVLVSWNALAIRAFAEAGAALGRWDYVEIAERAADFLWTKLRVDGLLLHTYMDGDAKILGFLDDHAALGNALLSLHSATLELGWLEASRWLCDEVMDRFWDEDIGTVFDTASDAEELIVRPRDPMDNATPSGPSLAAELLARAGHIFEDDRYTSAARRILDRESETLGRFGPAFGRMLSVLDRTLAEPVEVVIVGLRDDRATRELITAAHNDVVSNGVIVGRTEDQEPGPVSLLAERGLLGGKPAAYVCRGYACRLPVTDAAAVRKEIGGAEAP